MGKHRRVDIQLRIERNRHEQFVPNQRHIDDGRRIGMGGGMTVSKGRLNFSTSPWASLQAHHLITLIDSEPSKTRATTGYRPAASRTIRGLGLTFPTAVSPSQGQLAFGAPVSITNYIAAIGRWHDTKLERTADCDVEGVQHRDQIRSERDDGGPGEWMPEYGVGSDWVDGISLRKWRRRRERDYIA